MTTEDFSDRGTVSSDRGTVSSDRGSSRRDFFGTVMVVAGATAIPRLLERHAQGAESKEVPATDTSESRHPLDPLSAREAGVTAEILRASGKLGPGFRYVSIVLLEPPKQEVARFKPGQPISRKAFLVLLDNATGTGYETVVNITKKTVDKFEALPKGTQPAIMLDEFGECEEAVKQSPEFLAALKKRGVSNVELVMVEPWSAGNYGTEVEEDKGRRLMRALCFVRSDPTDNGYARPLDGVVVVVDLNEMRVVRVEDYGVLPLPPEAGNWAQKYVSKMRNDVKPLDIVQPKGPSFEVNGYEVKWQKWRFRIGFTPREGLVLHTVSYNDNGRERSILDRASVCEMVVPYGDPAEQYYRKNAFDIGEYGIGTLANSLELGCDCLGTIRYFDANMLDSRGKAVTLKNAI